MERSKIEEDEKRYLYLLTEKRLRTILTKMYNAILVSENAILLQREDPGEIDPARFGGTQLASDSMWDFCDWAEQMKLFTKTDKIYNEQFLKPARIAANLIERYRTMSPRTADLEGWIFSKSKSYPDPVTGITRTTLSIVVPTIQTVMTVRVSEEVARNSGNGYVVFGTAQPIPIVNRIHQARPTNRTSQRSVRLGDFDFLFTGFSDIGRLGESIEMENYCEVESSQSEIRQHLGFPFVSSAKTVSVSGPSISLLKPYGEREMITMQISPHLSEKIDLSELEGMRGKTVRFFGVQWYKARSRADVKLENSEVFFVEPEEDGEVLKTEDAVGMIRIRGGMAVSEVEEIIGKKLEHPSILTEDGFARFVYRGSSDMVCRQYQAAATEIRELRQTMKSNAFQITEDHVIDRKRMKVENIASLLRRNRVLYDIMTDFLLQVDRTGEFVPEKTSSDLPYPGDLIKRKISFMRHLEIFEKTGSGYGLTGRGFKIASKCISADLEKSLSPERIISIMDIDGEGIPPSVMLDCLRNGVFEGFSPVTIGGDRTEVFWSKSKPSPQEEEKLLSKYAGLRSRILDALRAESYPITDVGISERISTESERVSRFAAQIMLEEEERTGRVKLDGESWEYTLVGRIYDLFESSPQESFTLDEVIENIGVGTIMSEDAVRILTDFEKEKVIAKIGDGWTSNVSVDEKRRKRRNAIVRRTVLGLIRDRPVSVERVSSYSDGILSRTDSFRNGIERRNAIKEQIDMLVGEGVISISNGMVSRVS